MKKNNKKGISTNLTKEDLIYFLELAKKQLELKTEKLHLHIANELKKTGKLPYGKKEPEQLYNITITMIKIATELSRLKQMPR